MMSPVYHLQGGLWLGHGLTELRHLLSYNCKFFDEMETISNDVGQYEGPKP